MTTREQALTVDCPECDKPAGEMCVINGAPYVKGRRGPQRGYGSTDPEQIGREAKRPHNARANEYYWTHLSERTKPVEWRGKIRRGQQTVSKCGWYHIWINEPWRNYGKSSCEAVARDGVLRTWMPLGEFDTLEEAKAACEAHNAEALR